MDSTIDIYTTDVILLEITIDIFDSTIPSTSFSLTAHNIFRDKQFLVKHTAMKIKTFFYDKHYFFMSVISNLGSSSTMKHEFQVNGTSTEISKLLKEW